jgi:hypothetical protein
MRPAAAVAGLAQLIWLLLLLPSPQYSYAQSAKYTAYLPLVRRGAPIVTVRSQRGFFDGTDYRIVGEVVNRSTEPGYDTQVTARFYDARDRLIAVGDGRTFLSRVAVGEVTPFEITLANAPTNIQRYRLTVATQSRTWTTYQPLTIISQQVRDNYGAEVFGELQNDQPLTLTNIYVAVTFYDAAGAIVDVGYIYQGGRLATGESGAYRILTFEGDLIYDHFRVQAEGHAIE